jgi:hypothetical protein
MGRGILRFAQLRCIKKKGGALSLAPPPGCSESLFPLNLNANGLIQHPN